MFYAYKNNVIWLETVDEPNIIKKGEIVVKDRKKTDEIITKLEDINNYVLLKTIMKKQSGKDFIEYTDYGAIKHYNAPRGDGAQDREYIYKNPRALSKKILSGEFYEHENLLDFFRTYELGGSGDIEKDFLFAENIIDKLGNSSLDNETIISIISKMWPDFGYYVAECSQYVDINIVESYKSDDEIPIREVGKEIKREQIDKEKFSAVLQMWEYIGYIDEINSLINIEEKAKNNGKVLNLVKKTNEIIRR